MVNKVFLIGRLGTKPNEINTNSDVKMCSFSLATSKKYKDSEKTEWHSIKCFKKTAEIALNHLYKGQQIAIEGEIEYTKKESENETTYFTNIIANKIVFLSSKGEPTNHAQDNHDNW